MKFLQVLLAAWFLVHAGWSVAEDPEALPFPVAQTENRVVVQERLFSGLVEAVNRSTVSAQVAGRIEEIHFDVDDYVPKDSVLVRFRNSEQQAGLERAQATLAEAEARHREAQAEYDRTKSVFERKLVSQSAMDKASTERKAAGARLEAARAGVKQAQEQLEHTVVRAPYSGIVVERHVEVGEVATPGQPLMTGVSLDALRVLVQIPQVYVNALRSNPRAHVQVPGTEAKGGVESTRITFFPYADPQAHTFQARIGLLEGAEGLLPGMLVKVAFVTGERSRLLVPQEAIVHRSEVTAVYVVAADGAVTLRQVRTGRTLPDGTVEVAAGLSAGETVALDPVAAAVYLKERSKEAGT